MVSKKKFTQSHFEQVAEALQEARKGIRYPLEPTSEQEEGIDCVRRALSRMFDVSNMDFDAERFKRACIPGANVRAR